MGTHSDTQPGQALTWTTLAILLPRLSGVCQTEFVVLFVLLCVKALP